jgi:2-oxoisovalerate dehydrogenase E1 component
MTMPEPLEDALRAALRTIDSRPEAAPDQNGPPLDAKTLLAIFTAQVESRATDLVTRELRGRGRGYYSIASAGHEANAALAAALRPTDPALLHYRSGAFYAYRAHQVGGIDPVRDILLGVMGAADEPISAGRHKVFGRHELAVIPQTSTIASHLPRSFGLAFAIQRAARLGVAPVFPADAVVVCSFGDASINHSTALGSLNAAGQIRYRGLPLPLLFVCEDNGWGISTPTPRGWIEQTYRDSPHLRYEHVATTDTWHTLAAATELVDWVRRERRPALLHLDTVRLLGHAGADVETAYRSAADVAADLARDPIAVHARRLVDAGIATGEQLAGLYEEIMQRTRELARELEDAPQLGDAAAITAPLRRRDPVAVAVRAGTIAPATFPPGAQTTAQAINHGLRHILDAVGGSLVFGEDVAAKGGVYGVTRGLQREFGRQRVFDTLLDEQTILGLALGAGLANLLPIAEIQYLAYLHNAEDQLRGEAASLPFFSDGRYDNPMLVRVAGYGYQKGFGGHYHNDNSTAVLRDIPGLVVATPSRPDDAAAMLRTCAAAALVDRKVCVILEPIALYHTRDLYSDGDNGWLATLTGEHVPIGSARTYGAGTDLTVVTYANGLWMSLRVARALEREGIGVRVVDLRWLAPLPIDDILRETTATGRVLIVDETRRTGGVSEQIVAELMDAGFPGRTCRVTALDSYVPLGATANLVLPTESEITAAARELLQR